MAPQKVAMAPQIEFFSRGSPKNRRGPRGPYGPRLGTDALHDQYNEKGVQS